MRIRRCLLFLSPFTTVVLMGAAAPALSAQAAATPVTDLKSGADIYHAGCAGCHGPGGEGAPETTIGFEKPATFPDFTQCDQTTPEFDIDWKATIRGGGRARGFSRIMPAFGEILTSDQIDAVVEYMRGLCRDNAWPRGELNLPRALVTEKAYPEDETVLTTAIGARHAPDIDSELVYEHRFGVMNQLEVSIPFSFLHDDTGALNGGVGDVGFGVKRVLFSDAGRGSILSAQGEIKLPTGNKAKGLGTGVTVFEAFGAFDQMLPFDGFVQVQAGTDQPTSTADTPRSVFGRIAIGRSFREDGGFGRLWSPMFELITDRDLVAGASANVDVVPQFQVTLSQRQHVRANVGVQVPVTNTAGRPVQVLVYVLWDWFDGGLLEGWK